MTLQNQTLAQLNATKNQLTAYIIDNTAAPGTPEWSKLESLMEQREEISSQIDSLIAAAFDPNAAGLTAAVTSLQTATQELTKLQKTLANIDQITTVVDKIVQIAGSVVGIVGA